MLVRTACEAELCSWDPAKPMERDLERDPSLIARHCDKEMCERIDKGGGLVKTAQG